MTIKEFQEKHGFSDSYIAQMVRNYRIANEGQDPRWYLRGKKARDTVIDEQLIMRLNSDRLRIKESCQEIYHLFPGINDYAKARAMQCEEIPSFSTWVSFFHEGLWLSEIHDRPKIIVKKHITTFDIFAERGEQILTDLMRREKRT